VHPVARVAMAASAPILLLKRENQPRLEYMPVSSPTKCIACSLDTYRSTLYTIFFTFSCVFAFISPPKDGCHVLLLFVLSDCRAVSNGFSGGELFYAGAYVCEKIWIRRMNHPGVSYCRFLRNCAHVGVIPSR
jgi:hypothetical protein